MKAKKHIEFDRRYIPETLSPRRVLRYIRNMPFLIWANKAFQELSDKFGSRADISLVKGDQPVYYFILSVE